MIERILQWMGDEQVQRDMDTLIAIGGGVLGFTFLLLVIGG